MCNWMLARNSTSATCISRYTYLYTCTHSMLSYRILPIERYLLLSNWRNLHLPASENIDYDCLTASWWSLDSILFRPISICNWVFCTLFSFTKPLTDKLFLMLCDAGQTNPWTHQGLRYVCNRRRCRPAEPTNGVHRRRSAYSRLWSHRLSGEALFSFSFFGLRMNWGF